MKSNIIQDVNFTNAALTVLIMLLLTLFCQSVNFPPVIPLILVFSGVYLVYFRKASYKLFLNLGLLLSLVLFSSYYILQYPNTSAYFIPVASIAMLTVLLFNDLQISFLMAFVASVLAGLLAGGQLDMMLIYFIGALTAVYTTKDARFRGQLISSGLYVGLMQGICAVLLSDNMELVLSKDFVFNVIRPLFINGVICAFVVMAFLKVFEMLFGVLTNFSLLELSDFNQPLLRRMILEAPGTYHHSLLVSNLAEAAAESIGAHSLLARVGAYYHDIGKLEKPDYFTENQIVGGNVHDKIEPSISRLIILNHVKEGLDLARKFKLNPIIMDFIPQHHGTGLIFYFYQKALEAAEDESSVKEENFRYPGPRPQSRETAIVMLADSVEGAIRSLEEPTPTRIEEVVRKIINNRFIDGQLNECNLTLKEIEKIAETFTRVLIAMHHSRIKYPEKKNGDNDIHSQLSEETLDSNPPIQ